MVLLPTLANKIKPLLPIKKPIHLKSVIGDLKKIRDKTKTINGIEAKAIAAAVVLTNCNAHGKAKKGNAENTAPKMKTNFQCKRDVTKEWPNNLTIHSKNKLAVIILREPTAIGWKHFNAIAENIKTDPKHRARTNIRRIENNLEFKFMYQAALRVNW